MKCRHCNKEIKYSNLNKRYYHSDKVGWFSCLGNATNGEKIGDIYATPSISTYIDQAELLISN